MLSCSCCRVPVPVSVPVSVPARTLPYLIYSLLIYLPTVCRNHLSRESFIHSFIYSLPPFLPPFRLPAWYIYLYLYLCVRCVRVSVRVYPCICPCACTYLHTLPLHTHKRYISQVHIKDTCTRVSGGMWLFLILKIYLPIRSTQKNHPDERPCTRPVFHNFTR